MVISALHEGIEAYIVRLFEDIILSAIHVKCQMLIPKDIKLFLRICGEHCLKIKCNPT